MVSGRGPGGAGAVRVVRSRPGAGRLEPVVDDVLLISMIQDHLEPRLGRPAHVVHDWESHRVHVDVHVVPPAPGRPWVGLFTTGMSMRPMAVPRDCLEQHSTHAELVMRLPPVWFGDPFDAGLVDASEHRWPVDLLVQLAHYPHDCEVFVGACHTQFFADSEAIAPRTRFRGVLFDAGDSYDPELPPLPRLEGGRIQFLRVVPLHPEELLALAGPGERRRAALRALDDAGVDDLMLPDRAPVRCAEA